MCASHSPQSHRSRLGTVPRYQWLTRRPPSSSNDAALCVCVCVCVCVRVCVCACAHVRSCPYFWKTTPYSTGFWSIHQLDSIYTPRNWTLSYTRTTSYKGRDSEVQVELPNPPKTVFLSILSEWDSQRVLPAWWSLCEMRILKKEKNKSLNETWTHVSCFLTVQRWRASPLLPHTIPFYSIYWLTG
jgi:hypothetical protein